MIIINAYKLDELLKEFPDEEVGIVFRALISVAQGRDYTLPNDRAIRLLYKVLWLNSDSNLRQYGER